MMDCNLYFLFLAARGCGKTFLIAIFCCARCILYPGTKIVVSSGSRQQGNLVLEKILGSEILGASPNLSREINRAASRVTAQDSHIIFYNRSQIEVVASNDFARGRRSNILIVDEFRLVDKETIRDILQPFNAVPRQPGYLSNPKYKHLVESNKEIYMSSAYYKSHWSYDFFQMYVKFFLTRDDYFVCSLPYQLAILEGIADKKDLENKNVGRRIFTFQMGNGARMFILRFGRTIVFRFRRIGKKLEPLKLQFIQEKYMMRLIIKKLNT